VQAMKQYGGVQMLSLSFSKSLLCGDRMVRFMPQPLSPSRENRRFPLDMKLSGPCWKLSKRYTSLNFWEESNHNSLDAHHKDTSVEQSTIHN
jgi:hypothetical protein